MKHIKLFEEFINETLIEDMEVDIPKFKIDLSKNKETIIKLREVWGKLNSYNGAYSPKSELSSDEIAELEKEMDSLLKVWNRDAKKTCEEFEKELNRVKFPEEAKYKVDFKYTNDASSEAIGWGSEWYGIDPKRKLKAFNCYITISYQFTPKGKRKPTYISLNGDWKNITLGWFDHFDGRAYRSYKVPTTLDSDTLGDLLQPKI